MKGKRNGCQPLVRRTLRSIAAGRTVLGNESTADGKERALLDNSAGRVESGEAQAVGMLRLRAGGNHHVAMEQKTALFVERNGERAGQIDAPRRADSLNR